MLWNFSDKLSLYAQDGICDMKGDDPMRRRHRVMSERLKEEIAKELGVYQTVSSEGWGSITSRNCGNMVKKAIEMAERNYNGKS